MGVNEYICIGEKMKNARLSAKIPQKEMAKRLGISVSTYSNYENGYREPPLEIIKQVCNILGSDVAYLILGDSTPKKNASVTIDLFTGVKAMENAIKNQTIAAHFDGNEYTEEELEEIRQFAEFVKSRRKK